MQPVSITTDVVNWGLDQGEVYKYYVKKFEILLKVALNTIKPNQTS
jgi:hypothetical protein